MGRTISPSLAPVLEQLELDGEDVVTSDVILRALGGAGDHQRAQHLMYELRRAGWLGSLRTRGAYEFLPAARGGPYPSGDRFIEFRAQRAVHPDWPGVLAMESAASILGLAQRVPAQEVVGLPADVTPPKALAGDWRVVSLELPTRAVIQVDHLPTWSIEGLIAGISARPSSYIDIVGLAQWLPDVVGRIDSDLLIALLAELPMAARQRAAYLMGEVASDPTTAKTIIERFPPRTVAWYGPRRPGGYYDPRSRVNDTVVHAYREAGSGS